MLRISDNGASDNDRNGDDQRIQKIGHAFSLSGSLRVYHKIQVSSMSAFILPARLSRTRTASGNQRNHPEDDLHKRVAVLLSWLVRLEDGVWWTTIEHGGFARDARQGKRAKDKGVKPGVPDILIIYNGLSHFLELKATKGVLSENQRTCHAAIESVAAKVRIARSLEDVRTALVLWRIPTCENRHLIR